MFDRPHDRWVWRPLRAVAVAVALLFALGAYHDRGDYPTIARICIFYTHYFPHCSAIAFAIP